MRGGLPQHPEDAAVLVIWNRYGENHHHATRVEQAGGTVIVAENGYLGQGGSTPKFDLDGGMQSQHYLALACAGHNGSGQWPAGDGSRFAALRAPLAPWRTDGRHILVCPNRSFGRPDLIMPSDWAHQVSKRLNQLSRRLIIVRTHPGTHAPKQALEADLANAWAVIVWSSSAGLHALRLGVPVICLGPAWVVKDAAGSRLEDIENPPMPERLPAFERMAWAQWRIEEIATGEPLARLLEA